MDETASLKEQQAEESVIVNYKNLHANSALNDETQGTNDSKTESEDQTVLVGDNAGQNALKHDVSSETTHTISEAEVTETEQQPESSDFETVEVEPVIQNEGSEENPSNVEESSDAAEIEVEKLQDIAKHVVQGVMDGATEQFTTESADSTESDASKLVEDTSEQPLDVTTESSGGDAEQSGEKVESDTNEKPPDVTEEGTTKVETGDLGSGDTTKPTSDTKDQTDEWLDVLGNGTLRKKVIQAGDGVETRPAREKQVTVKYEARLKDGEEIVDSNDNLSLVLGEQEYLDVFDLVVALMQKNEKAIVECDAKFAYGEEGKPPKIPPKASVIFEIELLSVSDGPFSSNINLDKRLQWADAKRQKGNILYSKNKHREATAVYTRAIKALEKGWLNEETDEARTRINEMRLKCYNNLTIAQMKLQNWKEAFQSCRAAEKLDPVNIKTLFRKGKIHCELGKMEKGVEALSTASKLDPDNKVIAAEFAKQSKKLQKQKENQKKMYRRMLGTDDSSRQEQKSNSSWFGKNWGRFLGGTLAVGAVLVGLYVTQKN